MSSWAANRQPIKLTKKDSLLLETTNGGFCDNFNRYLYAVLYAASLKTPLNVNDSLNAVSPKFHIIQEAFEPVDTVTIVDSQLASATSLNKRAAAIRLLLNTTTPETLRQAAIAVFRWKESLVDTIQLYLNNIPEKQAIDVAVHIRVGDKPTRSRIPLTQYHDAVTAFQKKSGRSSMAVFVMSDSTEAFEKFKTAASPSWTIYSIPSVMESEKGHNQREFNTSSPSKRLNAYYQFMAELYTAQQAAHIVCTHTSNVGRFLYLTAPSSTTFESLDVEFSAI